MIRKIKLTDREIFIEMVADFYNTDSVLHKIPQEYIIETFKEVTTSSPYANAYIFENNQKIVGYGLISITYSNEVGGKVLWLEELYIKNKYRNKGIGSKFLEYLKVNYSDKIKRFRLELTPDNYVAKSLYIKKGYKPLKYLQMIHDIKEDK